LPGFLEAHKYCYEYGSFSAENVNRNGTLSTFHTEKCICFNKEQKSSISDENENTSDCLGTAIYFFPFSVLSVVESFDFIFHYAPQGK